MGLHPAGRAFLCGQRLQVADAAMVSAQTMVVDDAPIVVLDTKDWIELAKPEHASHYEALRTYATGRVRFPVSETALKELLGGASTEQRRTIVPVIEGLGCSFVVNMDDLWQREIECALDRHVGPDRMSARPLPPVSFVTDVFGAWQIPVPKLRIMQHDKDVTGAFLRDNPEKADALHEAEANMPGELAKGLLNDTPRTSRWRSIFNKRLLPHYAKATETYANLPKNVRSRFLRRMAAVLALNGLYDSKALAVACLARGKSMDVLREGNGFFRLQHHGRRSVLRCLRDAHHGTHRENRPRKDDRSSSTTCRTHDTWQ